MPVLLIHGRDETVAPIEQSRIMHKSLKRKDKQVEYLELEGEDHWLSYAATRLRALTAISEFVDRHLRAPTQ